MCCMLAASVKSWNIHQLKCQTWDMWLLRSNLSCACSLVLPRCFPPSATCAQVFNWSNSESHQKKRQSCLLLVACYPTYHCQAFFHSSGDFLLNPSTNLPLSRGLCKCLKWSTCLIFFVRLVSSPFHSIPVSSVENVPSLSELASWRKAISTLLVCDRKFQADRLWIWD